MVDNIDFGERNNILRLYASVHYCRGAYCLIKQKLHGNSNLMSRGILHLAVDLRKNTIGK